MKLKIFNGKLATGGYARPEKKQVCYCSVPVCKRLCLEPLHNEAKFRNKHFTRSLAYAADILSLSTQSLNCSFCQRMKLYWGILAVS